MRKCGWARQSGPGRVKRAWCPECQSSPTRHVMLLRPSRTRPAWCRSKCGCSGSARWCGGVCWCRAPAPCASRTACSRSRWTGKASTSTSSAFDHAATALGRPRRPRPTSRCQHCGCARVPGSPTTMTSTSRGGMRSGSRIIGRPSRARAIYAAPPETAPARPRIAAGRGVISPVWTRRRRWTPWRTCRQWLASLRQVVLEDRPELLDDQDTRWQLEDALGRSKARERARGRPFSRRSANARLGKGEHLVLMHQQW